MKAKIWKNWNKAVSLLIIFLGFIIGGISYAGDDDVPFFAGATGLPNVMFIFDNSGSMQDSPYLWEKLDGSRVPIRPNWRWRYGVYDNPDGTVQTNSSGNILYNYSKYVDTETEVNIPSRVPPPVPGIGALTSTITNIPGDSSNRVYDSTVDWSDTSIYDWGTFAANYRYYKVRIDDSNSLVQYATITSRSTGGGYWVLDRSIDYTGTEPYSYTIMVDSPGTDTWGYTGRTDRIYDSNVDWQAVYSDRYNYTNKILKITAGTNAGQSSRIAGVSSSGYWDLERDLPVPSDYTTRYEIVGSADDDRYAYGGNHPASKLYQAKAALKAILESEAVYSCKNRDDQGRCVEKKYLMNMGFATYMSARVPRTRAKYYRKREGTTTVTPDRYSAIYRRVYDASAYFYHNTSNSEFNTGSWMVASPGSTNWTTYQNHTGVYVGYQFDRMYHEGQCDEQVIRYTLTQITPSPTDSLPNRTRFYVQSRVGDEGGYLYYSRRYYAVASCEDLPETDGSYTRVHEGETCYGECLFHPGGETTTEGYYQVTYRDTYGDYNVTDPALPRYIDKDNEMEPLPTIKVVPEPGYYGTGWTRNYSPDPDAGDYTLVTEPVIGVVIDDDGTEGDILPNLFDYSYFRYPGAGTTDRPHSWSYRKTSENYVYRYSTSYISDWGDSIQNDPFFPAPVGDEQANHYGDDQVIFVNLPEYQNPVDDANFGDDTSGQNVAKILNYISLARVPSPNLSSSSTTRYDYTSMPYTSSIPPNSYEAVSGAGTPLAASLGNARLYYDSYFDQDAFTKDGCRNNYVILLTDGLETCDGDPEAEAAALLSMTADGASAPVQTFVIGFGLDDTSKDTLDRIAEAGGTGQAFFASNVEELIEVLREDIIDEILGDSYSRSAPVISRILEDGDELKIFNAYFDYPVWRGHLEAYSLNNDGSIGNPLTDWVSDCSSETAGPDGDAGCEMANFGRGPVYTTLDNGTIIQFIPANAEQLESLVNPENKDINGDGEVNTADTAAVINYTIDPGFEASRYLGTRDPLWPLGDIYNSAPVLVTGPKLPYSERDGYSDFKDSYGDRAERVYIGANDGMLHSIKADNGREAWAYIPNCILSVLNEFKEGHRFTVDLTIKVADVHTSAGWKTILASGLRKGGNYYYSLDVTNPENPIPLWEMTDDNMGQTWSVPAFGRININGVNTGVIFVGGGFSEQPDKGNRVYILNANTGAILSELEVGTSANNVPSELLTVRYPLDGYKMPIDYQTRERVDARLKGNIEVAYFADTHGTLWRLGDLNADSSWHPTLVPLFTPETPRPVYHRPAVSDVTKNCTRRFVLYGTGDEHNPTGMFQNHFYEVEDREWSDTEDGLHEPAWTPEQIDAGSFRMTWKIDLGFGEQVFSNPTAYRNAVYFTTYQPMGGCAMGNSYLYALTTSQCNSTGDDDDDDENGAGGGGDFVTTDDDDNPGPSHLGRSISSSPVIAPPKLYFSNPDIQERDVPMDPGVLLYWREDQ